MGASSEFLTFCMTLGGNVVRGVDNQLGVIAHFRRGIKVDVRHAGHLRALETLFATKREKIISMRRRPFRDYDCDMSAALGIERTGNANGNSSLPFYRLRRTAKEQ